MADYNNKVLQAKHLEQALQRVNSSKINVNRLEGVIDISNLPKNAIETLYVVGNDSERFQLTKDEVQNGDTVKVTETNKMYFVKDDSQLSSENGYEIYTAGKASSVDWSGVENKPDVQEKTDLALETTKKTVVGAINDLDKYSVSIRETQVTDFNLLTKVGIYKASLNSEHAPVSERWLMCMVLTNEKDGGTVIQEVWDIHEPTNRWFRKGSTNGITWGEWSHLINKDDLAKKQDKRDILLATDDKTIVGSINELKSTIDTKEPSIVKNTAFNKNFGVELGTVLGGEKFGELEQRITQSQETLAQQFTELSAGKQDKNDESLTTLEKTIVGAINEVNNGKANVIHSHVKSDIRDFEHNHNDLYYGKEDIDGKLDGKLDKTGGSLTGDLQIGSNFIKNQDTGKGFCIRNDLNINCNKILVNENEVFHAGNCPSNKVSEGYQKLASGLIIQWGYVSGLSGAPTATNNFPIAFPNTCVSIVTSPRSTEKINQSGALPISNSQYKIIRWQSTRIDWIAIGY